MDFQPSQAFLANSVFKSIAVCLLPPLAPAISSAATKEGLSLRNQGRTMIVSRAVTEEGHLEAAISDLASVTGQGVNSTIQERGAKLMWVSSQKQQGSIKKKVPMYKSKGIREEGCIL